MIEVEDLRVVLGRRTVLDNVNITVTGGELVYLLGRNGAGKSTLLRAAGGMITPRAGSVRIDGSPLRRLNSPARRIGAHLGIEPVHPGHTGRRQLRWIAAAARVPRTRVDEVIELTGIGDYAGRRIGGYSLGMRQRLGVAAALLPDAGTLLFDEPLNGLDVEGIIWLRTLLTSLAADGRAVLVASHLLDEIARSAHRVVVIDRRTVVADASLDAFVAGHADLESAYLSAIGLDRNADARPDEEAGPDRDAGTPGAGTAA